MSTETAVIEPQRNTIEAGRAGLQLRTLDDVWRFAMCLAKSGLAPKGIQTPEAITIAVQMGMEVGLPPMAALQNIAVINGRPTLFGDAQLAVVRGTGELESFAEWFEAGGKRLPRNPTVYSDDTTAVCRVKRRGFEPIEIGFSVADAKLANLWGKDGPWKQMPFRMMGFRARSFALRDAFGDALRGMRQTEEVRDEIEVEGRVVEAATVPKFLPAAASLPPASDPVTDAVPLCEPTAPPQPEPVATPRRGRPPGSRNTPPAEAPPLVLDAEPPTPREIIFHAIARAGLQWADVEAVLIANDIIDEPTDFGALSSKAVEVLQDKLGEIIDFAQQRRAA